MGIGATMMAAAILGFSGVLQSCPGFQGIIDFAMNLDLNAYVTEFIGLNVLAGILGSGTSAIAMFLNIFLTDFWLMGLMPERCTDWRLPAQLE